MNTASSQSTERKPLLVKVLGLVLPYAALIALSPRIGLPRWIGALCLSLALALLLRRPDLLDSVKPSRITPLQALLLLLIVFPLCALYMALDQSLR